MDYRPQFAFSDPPQGFYDETAEESFDFANVPALANATNPIMLDISLPFDTRTDREWVQFWVRGIKIEFNNELVPCKVRLRDTWGNYLSSDWVLCATSYIPSGGGGPNPGPFHAGGQPVIFESDFVCLPGSTLQLDVSSIYTNEPAFP